jgi:D-aminopeptidase
MIQPKQARPRLRDLGLSTGILPTGPLNAITDVSNVRVGHFTLIEGNDIRTGATAILPHPGNIFQDKVPAGVAVGNGYGKLMGLTQVEELGEIETPILLTNTLAVPEAASAIIEWTLVQPGNEEVVSINPLVAETNDNYLNDIRRRPLTPAQMLQAIQDAQTGPVSDSSVGAGTGTTAFGWKGGIGTSSRQLPEQLGGFTVGVLVQTNFGGVLQIAGLQAGQKLGQYYLKDILDPPTSQNPNGSCILVAATDAPLSDRNLRRMAWRLLGGMARTGASFSNGSGDYGIAFSTHPSVRRTPERRGSITEYPDLPNNLVSPLFQAAIEAAEEAIYNALFAAETMQGFQDHVAEALPVQALFGNNLALKNKSLNKAD